MPPAHRASRDVVRLDLALWGVDFTRPATPDLAFIPLPLQVNLHRAFAAALPGPRAPGRHQEAATVLLGRRVTSFRSIRQFEFRTLRAHLDEQVETHPAAPYGEGEYL